MYREAQTFSMMMTKSYKKVKEKKKKSKQLENREFVT